MIADYYFENMIDEPKVSDMTNIGNTLVLYGDDVTFEIKDLYDGMFMSKQTSDKGYEDIMSNIQELDYIAN